MTNPEIAGHPFGLCICVACGPPWRNEVPEPDSDREDSGVSLLGYYSWMALCPRCGSKRCWGAVNHEQPCAVE